MGQEEQGRGGQVRGAGGIAAARSAWALGVGPSKGARHVPQGGGAQAELPHTKLKNVAPTWALPFLCDQHRDCSSPLPHMLGQLLAFPIFS